MPRPLLFFLTLALPTSAGAQPLALGGWERLGDAPREISGLAFAPQAADPTGDPVVWAADSDLWRLDPAPGGGPGTWTEVHHLQRGDDILLLPAGIADPDTILLSTPIARSVDGGATFTPVFASGRDFAEAPPGSPHAGALYAGLGGSVAVSADRGATWTEASPFPQMLGVDHVLPLPSGRVVAGGTGGVALSDDGGLSFYPSTVYQHLGYGVGGLAVLAGAGPGGGDRLVAPIGGTASGGYAVRVSDDEGVTWQPVWPMPEGEAAAELLALPGAEGAAVRSALLVMKLGAIYRTDDGGETWGMVGEVPCMAEDSARTEVAALGPDGRLYVGCSRAGPQEPWSYRTADPVIVASEGAPEPASSGLQLEVRPNPASGAVVVGYEVAAPSEVELAVFDALGRRVAVLVEGVQAAGAYSAPLDAAALVPGVYVVRLVARAAGSGAAVVGVQRVTVVR